MSELPWPFRPCDEYPYAFVEIAPNEWVKVVLAGEYEKLLDAYAKSRQEYRDLEQTHEQLSQAAYEQIKAAQVVIDVWKHYGGQNG